MRVLIEGGNINPDGFGEGTKNVALSYARELQKRGHQVSILTRRLNLVTKEKNQKYELIEGIQFYRWSNYVDLPFIYKKIKRDEDPEIIHIFAKGLRPALYLKLVRCLMGIPLVFSLLGWPVKASYLTKDITGAVKRSLRNIDRVLVSSKTVLNGLSKTELNNLSYLPYGIATDYFRPFDIKGKGVQIRCLRGIDTEVLEAVNRLSSKFNNLKLAVNTEYITHLNTPLSLPRKSISASKKFTSENQLNIEALGFIDDMPKLLNRSRLFVDLVRPDGRYLGCASPPVAILEAMACGVPVLSTKIKEVQEVIEDGVNGFLVKDIKEKEVYNSLNKALTAKTLESIGKRARSTILKKYSWSVLLPTYEAIYRNLKNEGRGCLSTRRH